MDPKIIDHLFRHHSGKMVSVLTRIFGLAHLEIIEDAIQDTFIKASISWRKNLPDHPEAWLTKAAKNRVLDIFRKLNVDKKHLPDTYQGTNAIAINELFLDTEIEDAQLRMIFTACHSKLKPEDRISFALKTVSGFSSKEIASALLTKEETIKKRLTRARTFVQQAHLKFHIPQGKELLKRIESVMEIIYLIFNEGFHSTKKEQLIREELCTEAMRLCQILLKNEYTRLPSSYALFALMCFHSARLDAKTNSENELLDLKNQDRTQWHFPLIKLGNTMMNKAVNDETVFSCYHYEAAIAAEHIRVKRFEDTNWDKILYWYECLYILQPMPSHKLIMAVVCIQQKEYTKAKNFLDELQPTDFEQRIYLYHGTLADYYIGIKNIPIAIPHLDMAIDTVTNTLEKDYLQKKKAELLSKIKKA